ncbi:hypothetical protein CRM22_001467 [Opisthorchis felineus]|uniref:Uncharacterized protein n=1 Tax=Opisthorchis felineus TaxID=147828 RepID=A0A4S2MAI2_OPIFE|nr:hypothetical protein CRM22_001467 [Opisthorchis felineus]
MKNYSVNEVAAKLTSEDFRFWWNISLFLMLKPIFHGGFSVRRAWQFGCITHFIVFTTGLSNYMPTRRIQMHCIWVNVTCIGLLIGALHSVITIPPNSMMFDFLIDNT